MFLGIVRGGPNIRSLSSLCLFLTCEEKELVVNFAP